jgi:hypothetical protein
VEGCRLSEEAMEGWCVAVPAEVVVESDVVRAAAELPSLGRLHLECLLLMIETFDESRNQNSSLLDPSRVR